MLPISHLVGRHALTLCGLLVAGLLGGCGPAPEGPAAAGDSDAQLRLYGAGATFPYPVYRAWIEAYRERHPEVAIDYQSVGSGEGIRQFIEGTVDFGASDAAMTDHEISQVDPARGVVLVPVTAGMVVLAYNLPGVPNGLRLGREVYADILAGRIKYWNDPRIQRHNPSIELPHKTIAVVVRRDSSGTTYALTNHLASASTEWAVEGPGAGKLPDWQPGVMKVAGNEGVAQRIRISEGAIGYVSYEFAQRLGLPMAALQNKAGEFVLPSAESGTAGLAAAEAAPDELRVFVPDPDSRDAYPIVSYSWLLLKRHYRDPAKAAAIKQLVDWGLTEGQPLAAELGYIPVPPAMVSLARQAVASID